MSLKKICGSLLLCLCCEMLGCHTLSNHSIVKDRSDDYLKAQEVKAMWLSKQDINGELEPYYSVPALSKPASVSSISIEPPDGLSLKSISPRSSKGHVKAPTLLSKGEVDANTPLNYQRTDFSFKQYEGNIMSLVVNREVSDIFRDVGIGLKKAGLPVVYTNSTEFIYYVLDVFQTAGRLTKDTPIYRVILYPNEQKTWIVVFDAQNQLVSKNESFSILEKLKEGMMNHRPNKLLQMLGNIL